MKNLLFSLFVLFTAMLPVVTGEEILLGEKDFRLGTFNIDGTMVEATHEDGIFTVVIPEDLTMTNQTRGAVFNIPLDRLRGKGLQITGEVRYKGVVGVGGNPHSGVKILAVNFKDSAMAFFGTNPLLGTNEEWQPITLDCTFSHEIDGGSIVLGIQQGYGQLQFRNVKVEEFPIAPITKVTVPEGFKQTYTERVTGDIRRRGVMSPPCAKLCEKDIRDLAAWNANLIRYQIVDGCPDVTDIEVFKKWFFDKIDHLDSLLPLMEECGIKPIVDMHHVIGGRFGNKLPEGQTEEVGDVSHFRAMHQEKYKQAFIECWQEVARHYKGDTRIYAFDLCNEPIQHGEVPTGFWDLQYETAKAIREIDPEVPIMIESNHMANPVFFEMAPMPLTNIIYTVHMYTPGDYIFQGVGNQNFDFEKRVPYSRTGWNKERLALSMKSVREFQLKYGAKIQVGEFAVAIWAPEGADFLNDLISVFEEWNWDWTYHAFREWPGWSLEHEGRPDDIRFVGKTDRLETVLKYFSKNEKK